MDGTTARVQLLRPTIWLTLQRATVGKTLYISVPECGIQGDATLLQVEGCPPIAANPGPGFQIVTGTFQHQAAKTLDIAVEGESKPIGTTPNHPIWSVDRQEFVRADSLTVGERLQNLNGITTVTSISPRGPPEPVYNLEVQVKHTYYVADTGVLVHNGKNCVPGDVPTDAADRAKQIHQAVPGATQRRTTIAVTETADGTRVISSSERRLRKAQRKLLRKGEIEGIGAGHAEVTGINFARGAGLNPTGTAASRPICANCQEFLEKFGISALSPLK